MASASSTSLWRRRGLVNADMASSAAHDTAPHTPDYPRNGRRISERVLSASRTFDYATLLPPLSRVALQIAHNKSEPLTIK